MSVANNSAPEHTHFARSGNGQRGTWADLAGLVAILLTTVALVMLVGPAAATVLAAAGGFVAVALRLWLRRK
ncbi:hypothetical protein [Nocardia testacea]|uniref:hypothetical protein n=1 Tax=Nocardia testacea TaxID=248551 RepID=UPI0002DDA1DB|nr:hypothetical protein [Nocardia testacea]